MTINWTLAAGDDAATVLISATLSGAPTPRWTVEIIASSGSYATSDADGTSLPNGTYTIGVAGKNTSGIIGPATTATVTVSTAQATPGAPTSVTAS